MRSVTLEICGETVEMPVTFEAGMSLEKVGFDPLQFALKVSQVRNDTASLMLLLTSGGIVQILHCGTRASGSKLRKEQIGAAVYEAGIVEYLSKATEYLSAFTSAQPEHPVNVSGEDQAA